MFLFLSRFSILLLFFAHLVPPGIGQMGRESACRLLCRGPYSNYKLPTFASRPSVKGRFFGGGVETGWEDFHSHEETVSEGFQLEGPTFTRFHTISMRNHSKTATGGKITVKLGLGG